MNKEKRRAVVSFIAGLLCGMKRKGLEEEDVYRLCEIMEEYGVNMSDEEMDALEEMLIEGGAFQIADALFEKERGGGIYA